LKSRQGNKPADPLLEEGRPKESFRPFGVPRWAGLGLYSLFSVLLLIPLVRRWRRRSWWNSFRWAVVAAMIGVCVLVEASLGWLVVGGVVVVGALLLGPAKDPDYERKIQRLHGAEYFLNGGEFAGGRLPNSEPLPEGTPVYLLIRGEHLLIVRRDKPDEVHSGIAIDSLERILVDGETYVSIYVSEAKDPPVRESAVDQNTVSELKLLRVDGDALGFRYGGAFAAHLAGTTAHAVHSVREQLRRPVAEPALAVLRN